MEMKPLKELLCKIFGHKWTPWSEPNEQGYKSCKRCGMLTLKIKYHPSLNPVEHYLAVDKAIFEAKII